PQDEAGEEKKIPALLDSGYYSEAAAQELEDLGMDPYLATGRQKHHVEALAAATPTGPEGPAAAAAAVETPAAATATAASSPMETNAVATATRESPRPQTQGAATPVGVSAAAGANPEPMAKEKPTATER